MANKIVNIGSQGNDGTGDSIREAFSKVNDNFTELYALGGIEGSLKLQQLGDGTTYTANQIISADNAGTKLTARTLLGGDGITIAIADNNTITISSAIANLTPETVQRISDIIANIYTNTEIDTMIANTYTKAESDAMFGVVYTKTEVDTMLADMYTKTQVNDIFATSIAMS